MEQELRDKIAGELRSGITTEVQVVYLLVEIRKLQDRGKYKDEHLRMFCNWIAHTDLGVSNLGSTAILKEFDDDIARRKGETIPTRPSDHTSFRVFNERLRAFLTRFHLPTDLVDNETSWTTFAKLYSLVVSECPIMFTASRQRLRYLKSAELGRQPSLTFSVDGEELTPVAWKLTLLDGTTRYHSVAMKKIVMTTPPPGPAPTDTVASGAKP